MATDPNIQQLSLELGNLSRSLRDLVEASSRTAAAQRAAWEIQADQTEALEAFTKTLKGTKKLTNEQLKQADAAIKLKKEELKTERAYQAARAQATKDLKNSRLSEAQRQASADHATKALMRLRTAQQKTTDAAAQVDTSFVGVAKKANVASAALSWFGTALMAQGKQMLAQNRANSGVVEGTGSLIDALTTQQTLGLKLGMTGEEFAKISVANRQMINAAGGSAKALETLNPTISRMQILTGSFTEALELSMSTATDFAKKGVRPSQRALNTYTNDLVNLQRQTGMNTKAAAEFYNELSSDVEFIDILRSARADEREAILENQRNLVQHSISLGMSAEQAKEAAKAMSKIAAAKPLDRLKQAARIRALGGAMGIAGADAAAQAVIAGKRATPEQQAALKQFATSAANAMDAAASQGLGTEIFATTLAEKLDLEQYLGKGSPFSTSVAQTLTPAVGDLTKAYVDASNDTGAKLAQQALLLTEQIKLLVSGNHYAGTIAAGITALVAATVGGKIVGAARGMLGKLGGRAAATVGTGATAAGAGAAAGGSRVAGAAKMLGGAAVMGAAAYGVDALAGAAGIGKTAIDEEQDEANWQRMTMLQKTQSGMARAIETLGGFAFLDNMANEARASRIASETAFLNSQPGASPAGTPRPEVVQASKDAAVQADQAKKTADSSEEIKTATVSSAQRLSEQVKKLDTSNDFLKRIAEMQEKQVDLAERMLVATTMTEKERTDASSRATLRRDNKFGSTYNYV